MMVDIDLEPTEEGDSDEQEIPVSEEVLWQQILNSTYGKKMPWRKIG